MSPGMEGYGAYRLRMTLAFIGRLFEFELRTHRGIGEAEDDDLAVFAAHRDGMDHCSVEVSGRVRRDVGAVSLSHARSGEKRGLLHGIIVVVVRVANLLPRQRNAVQQNLVAHAREQPDHTQPIAVRAERIHAEAERLARGDFDLSGYGGSVIGMVVAVPVGGDEDDDLVAHSRLGASSAAAVRDGGIAVALLAGGSAVPCQAEDGEG
mmetsp:Transcript_10106/g.24766  ORF Transcript_10106/g.24766 Transcript_10106/m.24766 type:complete len:208 (+) Transcript_10106:552-1175(+)